MTAKIVILITVMMAGGAPQEFRSSQTFNSMEACEAAKARVEQSYKRQHPDAKVQKVECKAS